MTNKSGRHTVIYAKTKSDPICKWRNATIETVIELVSILPKTIMDKESFRDSMRLIYDGSFFRTAYQLALQLGLYYEDKERYFPRFDHEISKEEANLYMQKWIRRYYVPNPYTKKGFVSISPSINLIEGLCDYLENHPTKPNLVTAGAALFGGEMGNILCVKYVLNEYSNIIKVDKDNNMKLLLPLLGDINVHNDRNDKKAFFEYFN